PFGPISATISPSGTSKLTSCTARRPLKLLEMCSTSSSAGISASPTGDFTIEAKRPAQRRPHAIGQEHHDQQQAEAVEYLFYARHIDAEPPQHPPQRLGQRRDQEGADNGPEQRADAADDGPEDQLDGARDVKHLLRKQVVVIEGEQHAAERSHRR